MTNIDFIFCADIHLRDDQPVCREDDYWEAQKAKFYVLLDLAKEKKSTILCAGDLFHKAKSSKRLEIFVIDALKRYNIPFVVIPGNHDLPQHNIANIENSSIGILDAAGVIDLRIVPLEKVGYVSFFKNGKGEEIKVGMIHSLIHSTEPIMVNGQTISYAAESVLKKNKEYDIIISGDNHISFIYVSKDMRMLVNPGSMMRMTADQIDFFPGFFLFDAENMEIKRFLFEVDKGVISRNHIEIAEKQQSRMDEFVSKMSDEYMVTLDFRRNIESYFKENEVRDSVKNIVWECAS